MPSCLLGDGRSSDRRGLGAQRGRGFDHGHAFDFYTANLERKFGADWRARWREETLARLEAWGFNTIGDWSEPELCAMHRLPYTVPLSPEGEYARISSGNDWWGRMPDVFDPNFAVAVDKMADHATARFRGDPYLIGYFVGNELAWGSGGPCVVPARRLLLRRWRKWNASEPLRSKGRPAISNLAEQRVLPQAATRRLR